LYPSSPRVAAAEAPASPVPTTRMRKYPLLAGATSLSPKRCLSQLSSIGPEGALLSRSNAFPHFRIARVTRMGIDAYPIKRMADRIFAARPSLGKVLSLASPRV